MIKNLILMIILVFVFLTGCNISDNSVDDNEIIVTEKTARLIKAENNFGFELFKNIYNYEKESDNIMVSPLSVSLALAMTYNGADGETKTAMEKTLKVNGLSTEDINTSYHDLVEALKSLDPKVLLEIANAIFYRQDFDVEKDFVTVNEHYYNAEVTPLDFGSPSVTETINGWVAEHTNQKIKTILDKVSRDHVMFLLNAIYFKGIWEKEFNDEGTEKLPFYLENGDMIQTETMQRLDTLPYMSNDIFSAVQLSYGKGNYNMYVLLPQSGRKLEDIIEKLDEDSWESWIDSFMEKESVDIKLPRFSYKYEIRLNDVLSEMGMEIAFTPGLADFTGINRAGGLNIDYVKHKTFIEVNEEGTEAAAVTIVAIERSSVGGPEKVPFYVNRPFMYVITEKDTGAVLFMGTVKIPGKDT
jgi:serine protease inhibitor